MTRIEFEQDVSGIRGKLLALAGRFVKSAGLTADAEDLVQEALAELWRLYHNGYPIRNMEALAVKITKTVCVSHYRKRRIATLSIEGLEFSGGAAASNGIDTEETEKIREWLYGQLSDTQKRYLEMRNEREMSLDEIAAETGKPKASIKAAISQARKMMYERLTKRQNEQGGKKIIDG